MNHKAVFIDRDGTINKEAGYLNHPDRVRLERGAAAGIKLINQLGLKAVIVTNQAGVAKGFYPEELLDIVHQKLIMLLDQQGARIDGIYYCPHHPHGVIERYRKVCRCRKPSPGMIEEAARELHLDPQGSFVIGDKMTDILLAKAVGATSILVLTGYGKGEMEYRTTHLAVEPDYVVDDLYGATRLIKRLLGEKPLSLREKKEVSPLKPLFQKETISGARGQGSVLLTPNP